MNSKGEKSGAARRRKHTQSRAEASRWRSGAMEASRCLDLLQIFCVSEDPSGSVSRIDFCLNRCSERIRVLSLGFGFGCT